MTTREPVQTREELRAEMKAAARKMWDEADIQVSPHLANAIRKTVLADNRRAS